jgi:hypothetical protein
MPSVELPRMNLLTDLGEGCSDTKGAHETLLAKNLTKQFGGFVTAVSEFLSSPRLSNQRT